MSAAVVRSEVLGEMACPCCGNPVDVKTDKRGKAYLYCRNYRKDERGVIFVCGFHAQWGAKDSGAMVAQFRGADDPAPEPRKSPENPPKIDLKETENGPEPSELEEQSPRTGGAVLFGG